MSWVKWAIIIAKALRRLRLVASLKEIYDEALKICKEEELNIPKEFEATVRGAISKYCKSSSKFAGEERFIKEGPEKYRLKE